MYGYIYKRVNKLNNKIYVGQHKYKSENIELDESYKGSGTYFLRALKKYGKDNFTYELIDYADCADELNNKEYFWINELNSLVPNGYNICYGGNQFDMPQEIRSQYAKEANKARGTGWKQTEHQKETVRQYMISRTVSEETKEKTRISMLGNTHGSGNKGKIFVTDGKVNIKVNSLDNIDCSVFRKGKTVSNETRQLYQETYKDRIYINKDGTDKYIHPEELPYYLENGWNEGRCQASYKNRGISISSGKKGAIQIKNSEGKVKYIKPERLAEFEAQGFHKTR